MLNIYIKILPISPILRDSFIKKNYEFTTIQYVLLTKKTSLSLTHHITAIINSIINSNSNKEGKKILVIS